MADEMDGGAMRAQLSARSLAVGDLPEAVARRYFTEARLGRSLSLFVDPRIAVPAIRDEGRRLVAARADPNAIRDMVAIARHRGWAGLVVSGQPDFRREAWLAARLQGLEVRGYRPTERDRQDLARRSSDRDRKVEPASALNPSKDLRRSPEARERLMIVEAVTRARVASPEAREQVLAAARRRLTTWLERGARLPPLSPVAERTAKPDRDRERAPGR